MIRTHLDTRLGRISYLYREGDIPIIFLHGLGSTGNSFMRLVRYIPEKYSLYMIDLLGHGRSSKPDIKYTINEQAESVMDLLRSIGSKSLTLIGNSYGGWIAMRVFENWKPEGNLVLISSAGVMSPANELHQNEPFIERVIAGSMFNERRVIENIFQVNAKERRVDKTTFAGYAPKTLIIWGSSDKVIPLEAGKRLKELIPGSSMITIEGGGHTVHYTHPEIVAEKVISFIEEK